MSTDKDERWYVQFDSGDVTLMTLDEIQEAFEAGKIHANTYLIEVGDTEWKTLSIVAGLDDDGGDEEEELTPAPQPAPVAQPAYTAPVLQPSYAAPGAQGYGAQTQTLRGHAPPVGQPTQAQRAPAAVAGGGWPPVATAAPQAAIPATAARPATLSSAPPPYQSPYSMMPVTADLDVGMDASSFKSGKRTALVAALVALPVIGGGIYGLTKLDAPPTALPPVAAAAAAPAAMPRPNSWSSPPSTPTPSTPTPSSDSNSGSASSGSSDSNGSASSASSGKLTEDMKKALLANDTERSAKKKASRAAAAPARRSSGKKGGSDVFKSGGSASDPLNSKL